MPEQPIPEAPIRVHRLQLTNFRGFRSLDLHFPATGPAVIVGVNGAGKTTILDAIAMALIRAIRAGEGTKRRYPVDDGDVHYDAEMAQISLHNSAFGQISIGMPKGKNSLAFAVSRPFLAGVGDGSTLSASPCVLYFARSSNVLTEKTERASGFEFPVKLTRKDDFERFVQWFEAKESYENQERRIGRPEFLFQPLEDVRVAVQTMLSALSGVAFRHLRAHRTAAGSYDLVIDKAGVPLRLMQLSDGERELVMLCGNIVAALSRTSEASNTSALRRPGVVLIDEIELHLHPRWQRNLLPALTETFPGVQFIVTTHSPQVLSRVPNDNLLMLKDGQVIARPGAVYGRDSNSILPVMGLPDRPEEQEREIGRLARLIDAGRFGEAADLLAALEAILGDTDPDLVHYRTLIALMAP